MLAINSINEVSLGLKTGIIKEHLHNNIELKSDWNQKYGFKLSALGNKIHAEVSFLIVGVDDSGKLINKNEKWAKRTEEAISQHINENLDPVQSCSNIECLNIENYWVIVIETKNVGEVVYWGDSAYAASGTTIQKMSPESILQLRMQLPGLTDYTNQEFKSPYKSDLVLKFAEEIGKGGHPLEIGWKGDREFTILDHLGLRGRQAARLLFGRAKYRIVTYDGNGDVVSNRSSEGLFGLLTEENVSAIAAHNDCDYSKRALKEALANAVAHAAYFDRDGDIIVEIYPDHITISNLCLRESVYFANRWFSRGHKTVNYLLMETLRIANSVDELGRGKSIIVSESIKKGTRMPEVIIESAGKYRRWKLSIFGGHHDAKLLRLLERNRQIYNDERKALIAQALVLWSSKSVKEIRRFVDDEYAKRFGQVLEGSDGPIFYDAEADKIILARWARILLGEGKDSKALSPEEDNRLYERLYGYSEEDKAMVLTPKSLRFHAWMGETKSEKALSSAILAKWVKLNRIRRVGHGKYKFSKKVSTGDFSLSLSDLFFESFAEDESGAD